jgi:hypothetical protein
MDGILDVTFKSDGPLLNIKIEVDDGTLQSPAENEKAGVARFRLRKCPRYVRLHGNLKDGPELISDAAWVDDEASLGTSAPERRIAAKIMEAAEKGSLSADGMFEILQLLHQHLQQPIRKVSQKAPESQDNSNTFVPSYPIEEVFSERFGRPHSIPSDGFPGGFREADFFEAFMAYFTNSSAEDSQESESTEDSADGTDDQEVESKRANQELERRRATSRRTEEGARLRNKLMAALELVIKAMSSHEFVAGRPPERLSADIAATALLLRKGLADHILSEEDFASVTNRLWTMLFLGSNTDPGLVPKRLLELPAEAAAPFKSALASPKLTAALILWCFQNWHATSSSAAVFRFRAGLLAARLPWLVAGSAQEKVIAELRRLGRSIPLGMSFEALVVAWRSWVRAGSAFCEFEKAVASKTARDLAELVKVAEVEHGELLWQAGEFCVSEGHYRRDKGTKAAVRPLGSSEPKKIVGSWLVPVSALLSNPELLRMHEGARQLLLTMLRERSVTVR